MNPSIEQTARLVALASILQIAEAFLPHPIPGVRLGLANAITLIALVRLSPGCALEIALLRTVVSSLALGAFLAPTFIISFFAALFSTAAMIFFRAIFGRSEKKYFSLISVSLVGAVGHNLAQLLLAYLLIVRHQSIFLLAPWLGLSAVLTGWLTGLIALSVCRKLAAVGEQCSAPAILLPNMAFGHNLRRSHAQSVVNRDACPALRGAAPYLRIPDGRAQPPAEPKKIFAKVPYVFPPKADPPLAETERSKKPAPGETSLSGAPSSQRNFSLLPVFSPALKIVCLLLLALLVLFTNSFVALSFILCGLLVAGYTAGISGLALLRVLARKGSLIFISFLMPALFQANGNILWLIGPLTITREGLLLGALFASRLGLLLLGAALLGKTTAPQDLARGLEQIIRPLSLVGGNAKRIAAILAQALLELPELEHKARERLAFFRQPLKSSQHLIPRLVDCLASLCRQTELNGRLVP